MLTLHPIPLMACDPFSPRRSSYFDGFFGAVDEGLKPFSFYPKTLHADSSVDCVFVPHYVASLMPGQQVFLPNNPSPVDP